MQSRCKAGRRAWSRSAKAAAGRTVRSPRNRPLGRAVRRLRAHAGEYGIDPERGAVWGSSAGGHLVAMMGTSGGGAELEGGLGNPQQSSRVQAVVDYFGPTTFTKMDAAGSRMVHDDPQSPESMLIGGPTRSPMSLPTIRRF